MNPLTIPKDTAVFLGRPAKPISQAISDAIAEMVRATPGIREAYLPHCYVKEIVEPPAQILVVVLNRETDRTALLKIIGEGLVRILPTNMHLDVWPLNEGDPLLETVRGTRMQIHGPPSQKKPWWKIF